MGAAEVIGRDTFLCGIAATVAAHFADPPTSAPSAAGAPYEVFPLQSAVFPSTRAIRVLTPPGYSSLSVEPGSYSAFYFTDGLTIFRNERLADVATPLMSAGTIHKRVFVGLDNAASIAGALNPAEDRANEYLPYPDLSDPQLPHPQGKKFPAFLLTDVTPALARRFRVNTAAPFGIGGSSYGAIAALYTAMTLGSGVDRLLLESPPVFADGGQLLKDAEKFRAWPSRIYIGVGTNESDDPHINGEGLSAIKTLIQMIRKNSPGTHLFFNLVPRATHGSAAWAARLPAALTFLLR